MEAPSNTMAKRSRGSTSRPGQRPPLQRQAAKPSAPPAATVVARPTGLTDEEEARAAQLEAAIVAEERQAEVAAKKARTPRPEPVGRATSLEVSAAEEYAYVARDLRRVTIVGGGLIGVLLILWVIAQVTGMGPL